MRTRWTIVAAVIALAAAGCTTLTEVSAPNGANTAGASVPEDGHGGPVLSGDGRYSVFAGPRSAASPTTEVFRRDAATGSTVRVTTDTSGAAVGGDEPAISRDGRFVLFRTAATLGAGDSNLDPSRGLTGADWYVKDMTTGSFDLVSIDATGTQLEPGGPDRLADTAFLSATGRYVAFQLVHDTGRTFGSEVYIRDRQAAVTHEVHGGYAGLAGL